MLFSELEEVLEDLSRNKQRLTVSRHATVVIPFFKNSLS